MKAINVRHLYNNKSIWVRTFVTFITFLVRRNILCSITLRNSSETLAKAWRNSWTKWNEGKAAPGRKENGREREKTPGNPPDIVFSRNALHQTPTLLYFLSFLSGPSLFHQDSRPFVWSYTFGVETRLGEND